MLLITLKWYWMSLGTTIECSRWCGRRLVYIYYEDSFRFITITAQLSFLHKAQNTAGSMPMWPSPEWDATTLPSTRRVIFVVDSNKAHLLLVRRCWLSFISQGFRGDEERFACWEYSSALRLAAHRDCNVALSCREGRWQNLHHNAARSSEFSRENEMFHRNGIITSSQQTYRVFIQIMMMPYVIIIDKTHHHQPWMT